MLVTPRPPRPAWEPTRHVVPFWPSTAPHRTDLPERLWKCVPGAGFEPARPFGQWILSPPRLPFRHPGPAWAELDVVTSRQWTRPDAGPVTRCQASQPFKANPEEHGIRPIRPRRVEDRVSSRWGRLGPQDRRRRVTGPDGPAAESSAAGPVPHPDDGVEVSRTGRPRSASCRQRFRWRTRWSSSPTSGPGSPVRSPWWPCRSHSHAPRRHRRR